VETSIVYTQQYPITLPMVGTGQMSRLNTRCSPIDTMVKYLQELDLHVLIDTH